MANRKRKMIAVTLDAGIVKRFKDAYPDANLSRTLDVALEQWLNRRRPANPRKAK